MKCPNCGAEGAGKFCEYCGSELPRKVPENGTLNTANSQTIINNYYYGAAPAEAVKPAETVKSEEAAKTVVVENVSEERVVSTQNRWVALVLCFFFGFFGVHNFYCGKTGRGLLYAFTLGLFFIGWFIDFIKILSGTYTDVHGLPLDSKMGISILIVVAACFGVSACISFYEGLYPGFFIQVFLTVSCIAVYKFLKKRKAEEKKK